MTKYHVFKYAVSAIVLGVIAAFAALLLTPGRTPAEEAKLALMQEFDASVLNEMGVDSMEDISWSNNSKKCLVRNEKTGQTFRVAHSYVWPKEYTNESLEYSRAKAREILGN